MIISIYSSMVAQEKREKLNNMYLHGFILCDTEEAALYKSCAVRRKKKKKKKKTQKGCMSLTQVF